MKVPKVLRSTVKGFLDDDCPRLAAAVSYYAIFALPPVLVLTLWIAGALTDPDEIRRLVSSQIEAMAGPGPAQQIGVIMEEASRPEGGVLPVIVGTAALLFGATGVMIHLQQALNAVWRVEPDPDRGGVRTFLTKRVVSFGMVGAVILLLLASMVLSTLLGSFEEVVRGILPAGMAAAPLHALNLGVSVLVFAVLFAIVFRTLPDARIRWRDVAVGAVATAVLLVAGRTALAFYLSRQDPGSAFGAAGSLTVLLFWIYVTTLLVLLGAEFTEAWARHRGTAIEPEEGAVRVVVRKERARTPETAAAEAT